MPLLLYALILFVPLEARRSIQTKRNAARKIFAREKHEHCSSVEGD
uniref:Uncharacterized protein n=1 Tax=Triticum urartu TaxID=4572 RepID=A0A8R7PNG1_TRIUA